MAWCLILDFNTGTRLIFALFNLVGLNFSGVDREWIATIIGADREAESVCCASVTSVDGYFKHIWQFWFNDLRDQSQCLSLYVSWMLNHWGSERLSYESRKLGVLGESTQILISAELSWTNAKSVYASHCNYSSWKASANACYSQNRKGELVLIYFLGNEIPKT